MKDELTPDSYKSILFYRLEDLLALSPSPLIRSLFRSLGADKIFPEHLELLPKDLQVRVVSECPVYLLDSIAPHFTPPHHFLDLV